MFRACVILGFVLQGGTGFAYEINDKFSIGGGDTQDAVKNINGRNRDYLLTAWYKYTFSSSKDRAMGFTGGIIDATDYPDVMKEGDGSKG